MANSTASSSRTTVNLPYISIQPSFPEVVRDITSGGDVAVEDCWISVYQKDKTSVHGKVRVVEKEGGGAVELEAREGVECHMVNGNPMNLTVTCSELSIPPTSVQFPLRSDKVLEPHPIHCMSISPNDTRYAIGGNAGLLRVVDLTSSRQIACKGHLADLTCIKFFPSSEVVLSASLDMSIRVFSAEDGKNVRTLTGHTKSVSDLFILGKGRRILSSSLDGSIRLWTVAESKCDKIWRFDQPVPAFVVGTFSQTSSPLEDDYPELDDLFVIAAHTNGSASITPIGTPTSSPVATLKAGASPLHSIAYEPKTQKVALGTRNGQISLFQLPQLDPSTPLTNPLGPLLIFTRSSSIINRLVFSHDDPNSLLVASADGLPFEVQLDLEESRVVLKREFAGLDCVAATGAEIGGDGWIWIAAADGFVRRYRS